MVALAKLPLESPREFSGRLARLTDQIGDLSKDIHRIARQLHPSILDELGLEAALRSECLIFSEQHGIPVEFVSHKIPRPLATDASVCLYRVAQESLRNIGKHARADLVRVDLEARSLTV